MSDELQRRAVLAAGVMGLSALVGQALVPTKRLADLRANFNLAERIPSHFGVWRVDVNARVGVVNPQTEELLKRIYTATLERTYLNDKGQRVMLSIAYGSDQSDPSVQMHYPEVCYPAQGFKVLSNRRDTLEIANGKIAVRRLETNYANQRPEPVTYWTLVGEVQSLDSFDKRLAEIRHGLRGEIVDGMLVRVSTIDANTPAAFQLQDRFVRDMLQAMDAEAHYRLVGF